MATKASLPIFLGIVVCIACAQSTPVRVTFKQQHDGLRNLERALAAKPATLTNGNEFKDVLTKWIKDTDEKVLRILIDRMQYGCQLLIAGKATAKKASPSKKLVPLKDSHDSYEERIPPQLILKRLQHIADQSSGEQLKTFIASMKTPEGQATLKRANINLGTIDEIQKEISGDSKSQIKARNTFKMLLKSIPTKDLEQLREVYKVYLLFGLRQEAVSVMKKSTPEQLTRIIKILTGAENRYKFTGITFSKFTEQVKTNSGRTQVVEEFIKWASSADIKNLRRFVQYTRVVHRPLVPLHKVKSLIGRKIDRKSQLQLTIFLEVLETAQGKVLLNKLSVKPSVAPQDLLKQLKSNTKTSEANVKTVLKQWIQKLTTNDMKELQSSRNLFSEHFTKRMVIKTITDADQTTTLELLTDLSKKESSGTKFEGINFKDLKAKLEKDGIKSLSEVKRIFLDWANKAKAEHISALKYIHLEKPRRTSRKGVTKETAKIKKAQPFIRTTTTKPSPDKKITVKKSEDESTIASLADIVSAFHFQQLAFKKNSKLRLTSTNVKKALIQLSLKGSKDDIQAIFSAAGKGLYGYKVKRLRYGLFKIKMERVIGDINNANSDLKWNGVRKGIVKWVEKWKNDQTGLFLIWYKRGVSSL